MAAQVRQLELLDPEWDDEDSCVDLLMRVRESGEIYCAQDTFWSSPCELHPDPRHNKLLSEPESWTAAAKRLLAQKMASERYREMEVEWGEATRMYVAPRSIPDGAAVSVCELSYRAYRLASGAYQFFPIEVN